MPTDGMPTDATPTPPEPQPPPAAAPPSGEPRVGGPQLGEPLPPLLPFHTAPREERPLPRGCHPLVFGVVMATLQMAALVYFMPSCFGRPG